MNKVRKQLVLYAELAIFVLLTVLLAVINVINFTMVSDDADRITARIASQNGSFAESDLNGTFPGINDKRRPGRGQFGQMGPDSPEMDASMRYFTYAFDKDGSAEQIQFRISVVTEEEAREWARSLVKEKRGWTKGTYRYLVYENDGRTYVTVIDLGRELLPSYRILTICVCGELLVLLLCLVILLSVSRRLFRPLEEADRKQKQFIASIENDFKLPLTVINANTEVIERESGSTESTRSINRQVRRMTKLLKRLSALAIYEDQGASEARINLSDLLQAALDSRKEQFAAKQLRLDMSITPEILVNGDEEALGKICGELIDNSLKFSLSYASFSLEKHSDRIVLRQKNDTELPNGSIDQIFDRFTKLENAVGKDGVGLGLSYVKDIVTAHSGRTGAIVDNQVFELTIDL